MAAAKASGLINNYYVFNAGDDLELLMTHYKGENNKEIHELAWDTFVMSMEKAKALKLYGAGQDHLADAFSGNVKAMGPDCAEFEERGSDPVVVYAADKTRRGPTPPTAPWSRPPGNPTLNALTLSIASP